MPRYLPSIIIGVVALAIGFIAGALTAAIRGWNSPVVAVDVMNDSGATLRSVSLRYETCGNTTQLRSQPLAQGQRTTFEFLVCGEGGYQVQASLADGRELQGPGSYVESGNHETERVQATSIASDQDSHRDLR